MTGIWVAADVISAVRMNEKTIFQGTGAAISGLSTTYAGMIVFCTSTGSGFSVDNTYQRNTANTNWVVIGGSQKPYLTLSTTIGDYTSPDAAVASSGSNTFEDNYTTNAGWTQTLTKVTVNSGVSGKVACISTAGSTEDRVTKAIGVTLSNSLWIAEFDLKVTLQLTGTDDPQIVPFVLCSNTGDPRGASAMDFIGIFVEKVGAGSLRMRLLARDDGAYTQSGTQDISISTQYYIRLERTTTTNARLSIFSDSARTTQVGATINLTIPSTNIGLTTITHTQNSASGTATFNYEIDNTKINNNSSTLALAASNVYDTSTSTPWTSDSEANPSIYVDLSGSAREIAGIALNINKTTTTVTSLQIRASTDTTFTSGENIAYVNISDFTDDTWRFMANNFLADNRRYVQFYANETGVLSINEIKVRYGVTDVVKILTHVHGTRTVSSADSFVDSN